MKIHIVTYHNAYNYGAMLQAYGLQSTLSELGYSSDFLNVVPPKSSIYSRARSCKNIFENVMTFLHRKAVSQGRKNYDNFANQYLNEASYPGEIQQEDIYLSGSDQVWNPITCLPEFFLEFVPDEVKKISYAASMGTEKIPSEKVEKLKEYINRFHAISVRENQVKQVISEFTDKPIGVHLDPVFLLPKEAWRKLEKPIMVKKPYILVYALYRPKWLNSELKKLHKKTGYDIILVYNGGYRNIYHNKFIRFAGPSEFLYLIDHAQMVVSSSFHGVALSVLFEKEFLAVVNPESPSRISNLLETFGLQSRSVTALDLPEKPIDYNKVVDILSEERQKSKEYLKKAIEG